jgi:hypothetical protein
MCRSLLQEQLNRSGQRHCVLYRSIASAKPFSLCGLQDGLNFFSQQSILSMRSTYVKTSWAQNGAYFVTNIFRTLSQQPFGILQKVNRRHVVPLFSSDSTYLRKGSSWCCLKLLSHCRIKLSPLFTNEVWGKIPFHLSRRQSYWCGVSVGKML